MTAYYRPGSGHDEGRSLLDEATSLVAHNVNPAVGWWRSADAKGEAFDRELLRERYERAARDVLALASARAGAGEQQREQVVSLDDLRLPPRGSRQLHIATLLTAHQPVHNPPRRGDCGPTIACTCGHDRLGDWFSWHVAAELLALLDRTQPDGDVRQHRADADCWCGPVNVGPDAWEHQDGER